MNKLIKLEEVMMFAFSIYLFMLIDFAWWWYLALILVPDIGMLGYIVNSKVGAITYNLFHHKGIAMIVLIVGWQMQHEWLILSGIILFGHSSMDRVFGYGLKYFDSFHHTNLGWLKNAPSKD